MVVEKDLQALQTDHVYAARDADNFDADVLRDIFEADRALCICWYSGISMREEIGVISEESVHPRELT